MKSGCVRRVAEIAKTLIKYKFYFSRRPENPTLYSIEIVPCNDAMSVNSYFDSVKDKAADCDYAVRLVFAKAVLDIVGASAFNGLSLGTNIPQVKNPVKKSVSQMKIGDRGWIQNYIDYTAKIPGGAYQAENVIKVGNDLYWGFVGENVILSEAEWKAELRKEFNKYVQPQEQRTAEVPGFTGFFDFIDVAAVAWGVFRFNITERDPCQDELIKMEPGRIGTEITSRPIPSLPRRP